MINNKKDFYYRNIHKESYIVDYEDECLIISQESCYKASEEVGQLISLLPLEGTLKAYGERLEEIGIKNSGKVVERLITLDILRVKISPETAGPLTVIRSFFKPNIPIVSPKLLTMLSGWSPFPIGRCHSREKQKKSLIMMLAIILFTLIAGTILGLRTQVSFHLAKQFYDSMKMIGLVLLGMFCHELGHSFMCLYCGIGFRPIGVTLLIIYPVLYTNVSGIEALNFRQRLMINVAGLFGQSLYMLLMGLGFLLSQDSVYLYVDKLLMILLYLNLHPFIRTDGYWMMKDGLNALKERPLAVQIEYVFDFLYALFSFYLAYKVYWIGKRLVIYFIEYQSIRVDMEFCFNVFLLYLSVLLVKAIIYRLKDFKKILIKNMYNNKVVPSDGEIWGTTFVLKF